MAARTGHFQSLMICLFMEYESVMGATRCSNTACTGRRGKRVCTDAFLHTYSSWTKVYYGWRPNLPDDRQPPGGSGRGGRRRSDCDPQYRARLAIAPSADLSRLTGLSRPRIVEGGEQMATLTIRLPR